MRPQDRARLQLAATRQREERLLDEGAPPNPARITVALDARDLYGPDVDRACGVEEPTADMWETGEVVRRLFNRRRRNADA